MMTTKKWVELALLLAIALLIQSIRWLIPMIPGPVNMFFIGSLLNAVMAVASWRVNSPWVAVIGFVLPMGAFLQGQLAIMPMILVVALGTVVFSLITWRLQYSRFIYIAPIIKAVILYAGTYLVTNLLDLPAPVAATMLFMMSWPQIITGTIGIVLAKRLYEKTASVK